MVPLRPPDAEELEGLYSNFDHTLNTYTEGVLRRRPKETFSRHTAWNFYAQVWFDGQKWHSDVWVYGEYKRHIDGTSAIDVINQTNKIYGSK